jgi:predicted DsbA family dithiol-disulfide isomerase
MARKWCEVSKQIKIDFVSDVACPWCIIGVKSLDAALARIGGDVKTEFRFQPFELNPNMPPEGQDTGEHMLQKYGAGPEQFGKIQETISARGAEVDFHFDWPKRDRIHNTYNAHRLLHWASLQGLQRELKFKLFEAYFTLGENPGTREVLLRAAAEVGLDPVAAADVFDSGAYGDEVRQREQFFQRQGISSVPSIIINDRHLISGGQTVEVFEQALRQILAEG